MLIENNPFPRNSRMHRFKSNCLGLLALVTALLGAVAGIDVARGATDPGPLLTESDFLAEIPMVISATRMAQRLPDAPASITLIDRELIEASGAIEVADLFRLVPGFQAYHVNANKFGVTSHGLSNAHPGRLEVMVDGRSVYLPLLSTVDWKALGIELEDIDFIEVVRGSNVPAYGSNAFLGAINIITRSPLQDRGTTLHTTLGDQMTRDIHLRHNRSLGSLDYRLSLGYRESSGFDAQDDDGEVGSLNLRGFYTPTLKDSFDLQLGYNGGEARVGDTDDDLGLPRREFDAHFQSLTWDHTLARGDEIRLQLYHNYLKYRSDPRLISALLGGADPSVVGNIEFLSDLLNNGVDDSGADAVTGISLVDELLLDNLEDGITERYDLELQH